MNSSRVDKIELFGREFYIKRDDLLDTYINGNKARKLYGLINSNLLDGVKTIESYGGTQSNAMYALSFLAKEKGLHFRYVCREISGFLKSNPCGNFKSALLNGMKVAELSSSSFEKYQESFQSGHRDGVFYLHQGVAEIFAKDGLRVLAKELEEFIVSKRLKNPAFFLSSGTGTSAFFLSLATKIPIFTLSCAGDATYLKSLFKKLESRFCITLKNYPIVLESNKKIAFAKPDFEIYKTYKETLLRGVEFDLIYDCKAWLAIASNLEQLEDFELIFIHSGGVHGNRTMLDRYKREFDNI